MGGLIRSKLDCFLRDCKLKGRARLLRRWPCIVSRGGYRGDDRHKEPGILGLGRPRSCVRTWRSVRCLEDGLFARELELEARGWILGWGRRTFLRRGIAVLNRTSWRGGAGKCRAPPSRAPRPGSIVARPRTQKTEASESGSEFLARDAKGWTRPGSQSMQGRGELLG